MIPTISKIHELRYRLSLLACPFHTKKFEFRNTTYSIRPFYYLPGNELIKKSKEYIYFPKSGHRLIINRLAIILTISPIEPLVRRKEFYHQTENIKYARYCRHRRSHLPIREAASRYEPQLSIPPIQHLWKPFSPQVQDDNDPHRLR